MGHVTAMDEIAEVTAIGGVNEQELRRQDGGDGGALPGRADGVNPRKRSHLGDDNDDDKQSNATEASSMANVPRRVATNESRAKTEMLYWMDVSPPQPDTLDGPQLESAAKITLDDIAGCMMLPIMDLHEEDPSFPDKLAQSGVTHTEDECKIKGVTAAFTSARARSPGHSSSNARRGSY